MRLLAVFCLLLFPALAQNPKAPDPAPSRTLDKDLTQTLRYTNAELGRLKEQFDHASDVAKMQYNAQAGPVAQQQNDALMQACKPLGIPDDKINECRIDLKPASCKDDKTCLAVATWDKPKPKTDSPKPPEPKQ